MKESYPLFALLIEITKKCNAACDQCGSRCDINSEELLTKDEILAALMDIKQNMGTDTMINITGGEPLMRHDFFEIMSEITKMGFDWGMVTNGALITDSVVAKLKDCGMKTITISVDGLKETHESLRHLPGSFDRIINALKKIKEANFADHIQVTFTANKRNVYEFEELYKILNEIGLDSIRVSFIDPIGRALDNKDLMLNREEILYFTGVVNKLNSIKRNTKIEWGCPHYLGKLVENRKFNCKTGIRVASILNNGDIFVCPNVPRRAEFVQGNILKDSFSEVWKNKFIIFRNRKLPEQCNDCKHKYACKGDSFHTIDFETGKPLFCYRDMMEQQDPELYKEELLKKYPNISFCEVAGEDDNAPEIIIEPDAYKSIQQYFHLGRKHPLSMYEQQMALVGFKMKNTYVVRYVIPCDGKIRANDNAIFTKGIILKVKEELGIINKNYYDSSDRSCVGSACDNRKPMRFLGFIHSHPIQNELQYSVGDDIIHQRMMKKFGDYIGLLVNPADSTIGAYYGKEILQAKLILPEEVCC